MEWRSVRRGLRASWSFGGRVSDSGGEERVGDVCEQRRGQEDDADDEDAGLQEGEVLLLRSREDQTPHPRVVEERLDDDEAADEVAGLGGDDGDRGQER